jgi:nitrate reductase assembly molybdenum cofactor insertion protein NarJ
MSTVELDSRVAELLIEACEWRMAGLLFEYPAGAWHDRVQALTQTSGSAVLAQAADAALVQASEGLHYSLFGPGGPVSPREVSYSPSLQPGYLLSELSAYYEAFGYTPEMEETPDHIAVEAGFAAYLRLKEAYALMCGDHERATVTREAAESFVRQHLASMAQPIYQALEANGPPYLAIAARLVLERAGSPPGAGTVDAASSLFPDIRETEFDCDAASAAQSPLVQL